MISEKRIPITPFDVDPMGYIQGLCAVVGLTLFGAAFVSYIFWRQEKNKLPHAPQNIHQTDFLSQVDSRASFRERLGIALKQPLAENNLSFRQSLTKNFKILFPKQ